MKNFIIIAIFIATFGSVNAQQSCTCTLSTIFWSGIVNCNLDESYKLVFHDEFN
ncbi:MAG: hypothetical protein KA974_08085 [Saprospiraceae bacterium]|nr:hypothetical protein [Saprospiraceae bacterium]MBP7699833.1 hypothetical protein [Saprospiraceae bacterium]